MSTLIPNADALVSYIENFTGSSNNTEIRQCIFLAEMSMRNLEIPALRTNPYTTIGVANSEGQVAIPANMLKPIVFFYQGGPTTSPGAGPWIIYDRIGERDMIAQQMIAQLYLNPVNIPQVYRGNFAEVGQFYEFTPFLGEGAEVNLYYYTTWPELFSLEQDGVTEVQSNVVLQSWPEGYIYGTLREYYLKRKMPEDAAVWGAKFDKAWDTVMDQNNKGKWSGGHTKMWSVWQPRQLRRFSTK
jgi:hypothetical protein